MQGPAARGAQGLLLSARGDADEVQALFEALPAVDARELRGFWRGEELPTGHPLDGLLTSLGWAGKRFGGGGAVDPLVFERNGRVFAVHPWLPAKAMPLALRWPRSMQSRGVLAAARAALPLLATGRARAHLENVVRGGVETAGIVYEDAGIVDVLKGVGEGVVVGRMEMREMATPYFFVLRKVASH